MKLLRIYIENFGILSNYSLAPSEGITQVFEENGSGKSTLAVFIQTMFYGFPRANKNLNKDLRRKYMPWQGGKFGGFLEFEKDQKIYRLERFFGDRPSQDSFSLYSLNPLAPSNDFTTEIGIELFSLDAESFARSTYLPQQSLNDSLGVPGILSGLTSLVENTEDVHRYDKAISALRAKRSSLIPYRGQGGTVGRTQDRILQLTEALSRLSEDRRELPKRIQEKNACTRQLETTEARSASLQKQISQASEAAWRKQIHREYERMNAESAQLENELAALVKRYPLGFPDEEAIEDAENTLQLTEPGELYRLQSTLSSKETILKEVDSHFPMGLPTEDDLEDINASYRDFISTLDELEENEARIQKDHLEAVPTIQGFNNTGKFLIAAALSLILGIILFFTEHPFIASIFLFLGVGVLLWVIIKGQGQKVSLLEEQELRSEQDPLRLRSDEIDAHLSSFFLTYYDQTSRGEYHIQLLRLSQALTRRNEAAKAIDELSEQIEVLETRIKNAGTHLHSFCKQYGIPLSTLNARTLLMIREDHLHYQNLQKAYRQNAQRLSDFLLDNGPEVTRPVEDNDQMLPALKEQLAAEELNKDRLKKRENELKDLIRILQGKADQFLLLEDERNELNYKLNIFKNEAELLDKTIWHLTQARQSLTVSYLEPLKQSFLKYYRMLSGPQNQEAGLFLSTNLTLSFDRMGKARELSSFSAGNTDLYMFCMRLALMDALFPEEKPMLILDDPFVNLDKAHTEHALRLLKSLNDRQILYFTCHPSRTI